MRDPARTKGERTEFRDVARRWAEVYVDRLQKARHDRQRGISQRETLEKAAERYLRHRTNTKEYNTAKGDRTAVNHMLEAFGKSRDLHDITDDEIQRWFDDRAAVYAPGTLGLFRVNVCAFFAAAGRPVVKKIIVPKGHQGDPDPLADDEITAALEACRTMQEWTAVTTGLATGARLAELWAVEWPDFRADGRSVRFARQMAWPGTGTKGLKGKRNRSSLVLPGFMDDVPRQAKGRLLEPANKDTAAAMLREILKRAGLYKVGRGGHVLRHTFGRLGMEKFGWSIEMLRIFLGHTKIQTTMVYAHFGEEVAVRLAYERTYEKA